MSRKMSQEIILGSAVCVWWPACWRWTERSGARAVRAVPDLHSRRPAAERLLCRQRRHDHHPRRHPGQPRHPRSAPRPSRSTPPAITPPPCFNMGAATGRQGLQHPDRRCPADLQHRIGNDPHGSNPASPIRRTASTCCSARTATTAPPASLPSPASVRGHALRLRPRQRSDGRHPLTPPLRAADLDHRHLLSRNSPPGTTGSIAIPCGYSVSIFSMRHSPPIPPASRSRRMARPPMSCWTPTTRWPRST